MNPDARWTQDTGSLAERTDNRLQALAGQCGYRLLKCDRLQALVGQCGYRHPKCDRHMSCN